MITISPGHFHIGSGTQDIINEVVEARRVVNRVVEILKANSVPTIKVEDNVSKSQAENLQYLVTKHNATSRKVDVSVHFNSSGGRVQKGLGTEVLYFDAAALATEMSKQISAASGLKNRGAKKRAELAFLNGTYMPAILIEVCFVNSVEDVKLYKEHFEQICVAIAQVLAKYVGKPFQEKPVADTPRVFSTVSLEKKVNKLLKDPVWRKDVLEKGVRVGAFQQVWLERQVNDIDFLGLCALLVDKTK